MAPRLARGCGHVRLGLRPWLHTFGLPSGAFGVREDHVRLRVCLHLHHQRPHRQTRKPKLVRPGGLGDYARRKAIVEPVFGQMKVAQHAGQFRLRGHDKTHDEWALHTFCHNLRKLQGSGWTPGLAT